MVKTDTEKLLFNPRAAEIAADFWVQKNAFISRDYDIFHIKNAAKIFNDPEMYFSVLSGFLGMLYYSESSTDDGELTWNKYEEINDSNKAFSICVSDYIISDFYRKNLIFDVYKFYKKLNLFDPKDNSISLDPICIIQCIKYILDDIDFLTSRGVFIDSNELGSKFSTSADPELVGDMYAKARIEAGLSKVEAAEAAGMQEKSIRKLEKGEQNPTLKTLKRYADTMGYEVRIELVPKGNG